MDIAEFDHFVDEYDTLHRANIAITGEAPPYFAEYKIKALSKILLHSGVHPERILDFRSGTGSSIPFFRHYFPIAKLTCADISKRSLDVAEARFSGVADSLQVEAGIIPVGSDTFDVTFSACVFHHIPREEHPRWLRELRRVTQPGGMLAVFEHNPINILTVRAVNACAFDANARLIRARELMRRCLQAGWVQPRVRYHLFFPRVLSSMRPLEHYLSSFPFGAQYSVVAMKPD